MDAADLYPAGLSGPAWVPGVQWMLTATVLCDEMSFACCL